MKKTFLTVLLMIAFANLANAQKAKMNIGMPFAQSDLDDRTYGVSASLSVLFDVTKGVTIGPSASYFMVTGGEDEFEDSLNFLPIAGEVELELGEGFYLGGKVGYNVLGTDDFDGGFFYEPHLRYSIFQISYANFSFDQGEYPLINVGFVFDF